MKKSYVSLLIAALVLSLSTAVYATPIVITNRSLKEKVNNYISSQTKSGNTKISIEDALKHFQIDVDSLKEKCPILEIPSMDCPLEKPSIPNLNASWLPNWMKPSQPDIPEKPDIPDKDEEQTEDAFATEVVKLVNQEREKAGLPPLTRNIKVQSAAQVRAKEQKTSFSHTRPDGSHFSTALTEANVSYSGAGENIAYGQSSAQQVMEAWMNSPGHRANILSKNFTSIGVGHYKSSNRTHYWAQLFTY